MKLLISIVFTSLILFSGCASKNAQTNSLSKIEKQQTISQDEEFEDDELSEFEEELEVEEKSDPLNGYNRVMTSFNDKFITYVMIPVSNGYKAVTPKEFRKSVKNFFHNILFPVRFANNILQGKFKNSGEETGRFIVNSTLGIFGLFDVASGKHFNLKAHNEDFGQTLGHWGVGAGPHIVLPFFGPSNLRDTISMYPDSLADPVTYNEHRDYNLVSNSTQSLGLKVYAQVNDTDKLTQYEMMKKDAVDLYPYLRDMYEQYRIKQIKE